MEQSIVYLSLGSNLGNRLYNLRQACEQIEERAGHILSVSAVHVTMPQGFESDNLFLNMCLKIRTDLTPLQLLEETQQIERQIGRTEKSADGIYHDRVIDIDILLYGDVTIATPQLTIPHPRMYERDFVMQPLSEIMD